MAFIRSQTNDAAKCQELFVCSSVTNYLEDFSHQI